MKIFKTPIIFLVSFAIMLYFITITMLFNYAYDTNPIEINNWKILFKNSTTLDSMALSKGWKSIQEPIKFKIPGNSNSGFKYIWLKGSFNINDNPEKYYGLSTGRMRLADKIFINNRLIGSFSAENVNWHSVPRNYEIPSGLLKRGPNNIHISLGIPDIHGMYTGGISGKIKIEEEKYFDRSKIINDLIYNQLPFGIGLLGLGFIIVPIIFYLLNRREKIYLYFIGTLLYNIIFSFMSVPLYRFFEFKLFHIINISVPILTWILLILCIQSIYRKYLSNYNRVIIPFLLFVIAFNFIFYDTVLFPYLINFPSFLFFFVVIPYFIFIIFRFNLITKSISTKPDKYQLYSLTIALIFIGIIPISEPFLYFNGFWNAGFSTIFIPPGGLFLFAIFVAKESMERQLEIDHLYKKFDLFEIENKGLSITDLSQKKLEQIVEFINENYTHEISREGLASAVDMNPDYMSRLFKTYTGMKVSEYINNLRIEEAATRLKNDETKVIDIAFAVGFENTITFNRTFKSLKGLTPSEYRKKVTSH